ncbi:SH3 domain-containing protein [Gammaproteobacteria bacterium AH-315-M22]|nr:SH3 domain-containing protein [Gammaproteobacteria bacterium AH-315-M22]
MIKVFVQFSAVFLCCMLTISGVAFAGKVELGKGGTVVSGSGGKAGAQGASEHLVQCAQPIGVAALLEPESPRYHSYYRRNKLKSPLPMIKLMMQQSGCFTIVDRGRSSVALKAERALASEGEFQKGSNLGSGQMVAADYIITPDVVHEDEDAGGAFGGLGGLLPGRAGALFGGLKTKKLEAQVTLAVTNVRTSVQEAIATGSAKKSNLSFGGGGFIGGLAGFGGGYDNTDIGKIVVAAYMDAHNNLVNQLGAIPAGSGNVDNAGYMTVVPVDFRSGPSSTAPVIIRLAKGAPLVQTGNKKGDWWEVEAAGRTGWIHTDYITR